jgi:hypothetical protein
MLLNGDQNTETELTLLNFDRLEFAVTSLASRPLVWRQLNSVAVRHSDERVTTSNQLERG